MKKININICDKNIQVNVDSKDYFDIIIEIKNYIINNSINVKDKNEFFFGYSKMRFTKIKDFFEIEEYLESDESWSQNISRSLAYWKRQKDLSESYGLDFSPLKYDSLITCGGNIFDSDCDIELIHYPKSGKNSGWIITTNDYDGNINNFKFFHLYHLIKEDGDFIDLFGFPTGTFVKISKIRDTIEIGFDKKFLG